MTLLSGCNAVVLSPSGDIAAQQRDLLLESTGLMLLIIVPVMALTILFAWRYRQSNTAARYEPDWDHSTKLELVIWGAPLLIIICLGALTWIGTHLLDPYRPLGRIADNKPISDAATPLEVDVVALDWKWLFIYPQYGIAAVNEMAAPVDRPISFRISASSVMNSFYVPALAGQIYAMPGMVTQLHAVINEPGDFTGFSANYSGSGFSGMRFTFKGQAPADFDAWVAAIKAKGGSMDRQTYLALVQPSEDVPVSTYGSVDASLFNAIVNLCVTPGKACMSQMMSSDTKRGHGSQGGHMQSLETAPGSPAGPSTGRKADATDTPATPKPDVAEASAPLAPTGAGEAPGASPQPSSTPSPLPRSAAPAVRDSVSKS